MMRPYRILTNDLRKQGGKPGGCFEKRKTQTTSSSRKRRSYVNDGCVTSWEPEKKNTAHPKVLRKNRLPKILRDLNRNRGEELVDIRRDHRNKGEEKERCGKCVRKGGLTLL